MLFEMRGNLIDKPFMSQFLAENINFSKLIMIDAFIVQIHIMIVEKEIIKRQTINLVLNEKYIFYFLS